MNKYDILEQYLQSLQEERDDTALAKTGSDAELRQILKFARDLKVLTSSEASQPSLAFVRELKVRLNTPDALREAKRTLPKDAEQEVGGEGMFRRRSAWKIWSPAFALVAIGVVALSVFQPSGNGNLLSFVTSKNPLSRVFSPQTSAPTTLPIELDDGSVSNTEVVNEGNAEDRAEGDGREIAPLSPSILVNDAIIAQVPLDLSGISSLTQDMDLSLASLRDGMTEWDSVSSDTTLASFSADFVVDF